MVKNARFLNSKPKITNYLSFNNATVTISGEKNANGEWITKVNVYDKYDFAPEKFNSIDSFKTALGGAAETAAWIDVTGFAYTYAPDGNQMSKTDTVQNTRTSYTYDLAGQLLCESRANTGTNEVFYLTGDYSEATTRQAFSVYMGSKQPPGLIVRRNAEINMFLYGTYDSSH